MTHIKTRLFLSLLMLHTATSTAAEAVFSSGYLEGKWSQSGTQGCSSEHADYVIFHNDRTLSAGNGKKVSAVGFWEMGDGTVTLHMLVSPSGGGGGHPFYQQRYYYQYLTPKILSIQADNFDYTLDSGAQAGEKRTLSRCP